MGFAIMMARLAVAGPITAAVLYTLPALAQDQPGRFTMKDIEGGILRLDTQTGDVSHCREKNENWVCETAADDRSAMHDEIARLQQENEQLQSRIAELEKQPGTGKQNELNLPSDEDMDEVMGFMERLMRRFYAFTRSLSDQLGEET